MVCCYMDWVQIGYGAAIALSVQGVVLFIVVLVKLFKK